MHVTGVARVPPDIRPDLGPIVDGLLGIATYNTLPTGPCALGQTLVLPVIAVDPPTCPHPDPNWPYRDTLAQFDEPRVFTFVNVKFTSITCAGGGPPITAPGTGPNACDADPVRAQNCSGAPGAAGALVLTAQIDCNALVATGPAPGTVVRPRLVR
jgi:hypothetical protein